MRFVNSVELSSILAQPLICSSNHLGAMASWRDKGLKWQRKNQWKRQRTTDYRLPRKALWRHTQKKNASCLGCPRRPCIKIIATIESMIFMKLENWEKYRWRVGMFWKKGWTQQNDDWRHMTWMNSLIYFTIIGSSETYLATKR